MQELTDDQLDGLFRKSAEEFNPPADSAAWADLQTRLDAHDRTAPGKLSTRNRLVRWGLPLLLLFVLTSSGWYLAQRTQTGQVNKATPVVALNVQAERIQLKSQPESAPTSARPAPAFTAPDVPKPTAVNPPETKKQPAQLIPNGASASTEKPEPAPIDNNASPATNYINPATKSKSAVVQRETGAMPVAGSPGVTGPMQTNRAANRRQSVPGGTRPKRIFPGSLATPANTPEPAPRLALNRISAGATPPAGPRIQSLNPDWTPSSTQPASAADTPTTTESSDVLVSMPLTWLAIRPGQWPATPGFINREVSIPVVPAESQAQPAVSSVVTQRGFSIRFVLSPDLSAVGLHNFTRPGTNVGLLLEYRLAPRWSVQAGALWSTKVYTAQPGDYTWPPHVYWKVNPTSVDGRCAMVDVPLNVRYDFALRSRADGRQPSRWFASAGVTSYLILNEQYNYNYAWPTDPAIKNRETRIDSSSRYGISQLNVSAGYERALSRRLSWQVEPFMKVPLKGIGYYKINLLSTGAFVSLRYKL